MEKVFILHTFDKANRLLCDMTLLAAGPSSHLPFPSLPPLSVHYFLYCVCFRVEIKTEQNTDNPAPYQTATKLFFCLSKFSTDCCLPFSEQQFKEVFLCIFFYPISKSSKLEFLLWFVHCDSVPHKQTTLVKTK